MKLQLWIFICVLYPCFAFATMDSDAYSVPTNSKWTEIAVDKLDGMWGKSFDIVEYKMKQIAPHIVDMISNENEVVRARMYKNYLAQQAAKFALDAAIEDMHMSSQQTGRAIKTYNKDKQIITVTKLVPGADGMYWLDRGALDSTECFVGDTGYYRCIYPNDYREKMLIISNGGFEIVVEEDIDVNNKMYHVFTDMFYSTDSDNWQDATDVYFEIAKTRYPYAEYYNYMAIENKRVGNNEKLADLSKRKIKKIRRECAASQGTRITSVYDCSLESKAAVAEEEMMNAGVDVSGQAWSVFGK